MPPRQAVDAAESWKAAGLCAAPSLLIHDSRARRRERRRRNASAGRRPSPGAAGGAPRGTIVALCTGCAPSVCSATSAWPPSWYAVSLRQAGGVSPGAPTAPRRAPPWIRPAARRPIWRESVGAEPGSASARRLACAPRAAGLLRDKAARACASTCAMHALRDAFALHPADDGAHASGATVRPPPHYQTQVLSEARRRARAQRPETPRRVRSRDGGTRAAAMGSLRSLCLYPGPGRALAVLLADDGALALGAHEDAVLGVLQRGHVHRQQPVARGLERGHVDQVGQVRAREPRRAPRDHLLAPRGQ